ncbi:MAG TPA: PucR family transcriptional regulator ligand-binding domain-containing protein [Actinomycetales bacterium]|nr:PucR family transcriptional regulator ligand-binding domain-containing protein [Actinomycetales bacterium]
MPSPGPPARAGVPLREVLRADVLAGASVLAGAAGLDRAVTRLNVMEVPDILAWVRPGELLLTTGYPLREAPEGLADLVEALHAKDVAALAVKVGRYLDEVPQDALDRADALGFPVLSLPPMTSFDDVMTDVLTDVVNRQARTLARAEAVHRGLIEIVLGGGGLEAVADGLSDALDAVVLVTTPDGRLVAVAGPAGQRAEVLAGPWMDASGRLRTEDVSAALGLHRDGAGGHAVVAVAAGALDHGRIVAFPRTRTPDADDLHALERAATVCALVVNRDLAVAAVEDKYRADFLRDLVTGRTGPGDQVGAHAATLGWDLDRPLVVLVLEPDSPDGPDGDGSGAVSGARLRPLVERQAAALAGAVRVRDAGAAVCGFSGEVVALLGVPDDGDVARLVQQVVGVVRGDGGGGRRPFTLGVSRVCPGTDDVPAGYSQARTAVRVGRQVSGAGTVTHFDALGVYRLLSLVPDPAELRSFASETLGPLAGEDAEADDMRRTLDVLLETNLNVAETARRLHFHYNTLRYRIAKLERILGPFTEDATLRLDLALALRVVAMRGLR